MADTSGIDPNIRALVEALNKFDGITTNGSCGGHETPKPYQDPAGQWSITFRVEHTEDGWLSLEFLAWIVNDYRKALNRVALTVHSFPPFLNEPGNCLYFSLRGKEVDPDKFAEWIDQNGHEYRYLLPPPLGGEELRR